MRQYTFTENGFTFERVGKKQARKAYNNGLLSCKGVEMC